MIPSWRSLLFCAADDHRRLAKITERGAHAVILDLEDAVPLERKDAARAALPASVAALDGLPVVIRINADWRTAYADLAVAVQTGVSAIMVPKVAAVERLSVIGQMVDELAETAALPVAPALIALIESPLGLAQLDALATVDGVIGLALGSEDFALTLGVPPTPDALDLPCRMIGLAAAARGVMAIGLPISISTIEDVDAWAKAVGRARAFGMTGALCVHPRQIGPVNQGFAPTENECEAARRVLAAWTAADGAGVIMVEGKMVDPPVLRAAQRILARK